MWDSREIAERLGRLDALLGELVDGPDETATATVRALADVYGEALERIVARADGALLDALAGDDLLGHLLLVHDLHPQDAHTRVRAALARLAPGVRAELRELADGVATVEVTEGAAEDLPDLVRAAAPEVAEVRVDRRTAPAFVPLASVRAR